MTMTASPLVDARIAAVIHKKVRGLSFRWRKICVGIFVGVARGRTASNTLRYHRPRVSPRRCRTNSLWRAEQEVWNWESVRDDLTNNSKLRQNKWRRFRFTKASPLKVHCGDLNARFCRKISSRKLRNIPFI